MGCGCQDKKRMKDAIAKMKAEELKEAVIKRQLEIKSGKTIIK